MSTLADVRSGNCPTCDGRLLYDFLRFNKKYFTPELFQFMTVVRPPVTKKWELFLIPSLMDSLDGAVFLNTLLTEMKPVGQINSLKHATMVRCHFSLFIDLVRELENGILSEDENVLINFERISDYGEDLDIIELRNKFERIFFNDSLYVDEVLLKLFIIARELKFQDDNAAKLSLQS